jgi:hypothetical protein
MELEKDKKRNKKIEIYLGLILLIISFGSWWYFYSLDSYYYLFFPIFFSLITLSVLLNPFSENTIVNYILKIIGGVLGVSYLIATILISFLLISLSAMLVLNIFAIIFKGIVLGLVYLDIVVDQNLFELPILYCSTLFTLVILSYFGDKTIVALDKILSIGATNKNEESRNIAKYILKLINVRRRIYELSIILYVLSVIEDMSTISLISINIWEAYKEIALEVLITYVAIDGYVSNFFGNSKK